MNQRKPHRLTNMAQDVMQMLENAVYLTQNINNFIPHISLSIATETHSPEIIPSPIATATDCTDTWIVFVSCCLLFSWFLSDLSETFLLWTFTNLSCARELISTQILFMFAYLAIKLVLILNMWYAGLAKFPDLNPELLFTHWRRAKHLKGENLALSTGSDCRNYPPKH